MKVIKRLCAKMFYVYEWALYKCIIIIIIIIIIIKILGKKPAENLTTFENGIFLGKNWYGANPQT